MDFIRKEGFILAAIPLIAFVGAYIFEIGYADAFNFPHELIEIDLRTIVIALACGIILLPGYLFYTAYIPLMYHPDKGIRLIALNMILLIPSVAAAYATGFRSTEFNIMLGFAFIYAIIPTCWVLFKYRQLGLLGALNAAAANQGMKDRQWTETEKVELGLKDRLYGTFFILAILAIFLLMLRGAGTAVADWKTEYHTLNIRGQEYAILAGYGDLFVLGGIQDNQFNGDISVIAKTSDDISKIQSRLFKQFLR